MNVLCANVGKKYAGNDYVGKLYRGLRRNTEHDFNFICLTQSPYPTWWAYLGAFPIQERTIIIDIDMVITGNVDFLFEYEGEFCIRRNPWPGAWCDACLINTTPEAAARVYAAFLKDPQRAIASFRSDQEYIASAISEREADTWQAIAPGKTLSYKADNLEQSFKSASIVTFHGEPKPEQVSSPWVKEHWR